MTYSGLMLYTLVTALLAFISTNIDDIIVLMVLFARAADRRARMAVTAGQYAGMALLTVAGIAGGAGFAMLPHQYTRLLGLIPVILGVRAWFSYKKTADDGSSRNDTAFSTADVMMLTVSDGADNIGVYIPLFTGISTGETVLTAAVFAVMTGIWCLLAYFLASVPSVQNTVRRAERYLVPLVFTAIGIAVLLR